MSSNTQSLRLHSPILGRLLLMIGLLSFQPLLAQSKSDSTILLPDFIRQQRLNRLKTDRRLRDIEGTTINAGRKTEVVLLRDMTINKASNNARQIYSKVVGLTINESSDGGLQLNLGARGLNPNRTANFNTRQNGYDISADVLGYPESYYTPPAEALREIQIIRGASALQYGTQFGGMINFVMNRPDYRPVHLNQRLSLGSHNLKTSFTSLSGTKDKFSYYSYFHYKQGDGFRPNSAFKSYNGFVNLNYRLSPRQFLSLDWFKYHYLARQAGGLTNKMFYEDPRQSNRHRNWFRIDWNLLSLKYKWQLGAKHKFSVDLFGLVAERAALGFRTNRVSIPDNETEPRDLLIGKFRNWGTEARYLREYTAFDLRHNFLIGAKYYQSANYSEQGAGSISRKADFNFATEESPYYPHQSKFKYPNLNFALFSEQIIHLGERTTLTPGARLEYIKTQSQGTYRVIFIQGADIRGDHTENVDVTKERLIGLVGLSFSHKFAPRWAKASQLELYANLSQNYRSVTFNDIHSNTPSFAISPTITDERGFSSDLGIRGQLSEDLRIDLSAFCLYYGNKIGEYFHKNEQGQVERYRDNVGTALSYGIETLLNWDISKRFFSNQNWHSALFLNLSLTDSRYLRSDVPNIKGNKVEFVPFVNLKLGGDLAYKKLKLSTQLTYLSEQFSEATNQVSSDTENEYGIYGTIPQYAVWDISSSYRFNEHFSLEASLNNVLDYNYFTQRATGYPGPGIIPSPPRNVVLTLSMSY